MNIFFDVDYTILGGDLSLRPGTLEVFARLHEEGHAVYVWSGEGERWEVVREHGLESFVSGVFEKPLHDHENRLVELGIPVLPDFVVDDYADIVRVFGGVRIPYYYGRNYARGRADDEMEIVYAIIQAHLDGGHIEDPRYYPRTIMDAT